MLGPVGVRRLALMLLVWGSSSCAHPATAIVVAVDSNLAVPGELSSVHVEVGGTACSDSTCAHDFPLAVPGSLPFSFTVTPQSGVGPLSLVLSGLDASGHERVVREVSSSFVPGRTLLLQIRLDRACLDAAACPSGSTCIGGDCTTDAIDPARLSDVVPGAELRFDDAGVPTDAGGDPDAADAPDAGHDAASDDAGDAARGPDAGTIPRTCADLPADSSPGAYMIDPDGEAGLPPFLDYCETIADGGGWTLIAKVDPATTNLAFGASRWTESSSDRAFGTADLSVEDALFPSYWLMQVREVRIVMAPAATPTATRTLVTAFAPAATVSLRAAMEPGVHPHLDAPLAQWVALVGASPTPPAPLCDLPGIPAQLPSGMPEIRVRIGYVWSDAADCSSPGFWAGIGAAGASCSHNVASTAGGGRLCGTGAQRHDYPLAAWLFAR